MLTFSYTLVKIMCNFFFPSRFTDPYIRKAWLRLDQHAVFFFQVKLLLLQLL